MPNIKSSVGTYLSWKRCFRSKNLTWYKSNFFSRSKGAKVIKSHIDRNWAFAPIWEGIWMSISKPPKFHGFCELPDPNKTKDAECPYTPKKQRWKSKSGVYIVFSFNNIGAFLYRQIERNRVFRESESAIRIDENGALPW